MANPSHSTASPDPRNPQDDAQPDSRVRGNDGGGENPQDALDRRSLLTGAAACAIVPLTRVVPAKAGIHVDGGLDARFHGHDEMGLGPDPALLAYARVKEVDSWFVGVRSDEDDPYYLALLAAYDRAEAAFADTRATTPTGVRAKLNHVAYLYAPDAEGEMCRSSLATSIVADFERVMAGRAI